MKRILLALLCTSCLAFPEDKPQVYSMPKRMGQRTWTLTPVLHSFVDIVQKEAERTALDGERKGPPPVEWRVRRAEYDGIKAMLSKYVEWSQVAKKNGVRTFEKQIEKPPAVLDCAMFFKVKDGVCSLYVAHSYNEAFHLSDEDVSAIQQLIASLERAEQSAKKAIDPSGAGSLFK